MSKPRTVHDLSDDERLELALALLARTDRRADGVAALRRTYPAAPDAMLQTAAHHIYTDGAPAVIAFLADAELAIREPGHEIDYGAIWQVLYSVYNWLQLRALLPNATDEMLSILEDIAYLVEQGDREHLLESVEDLRSVVQGHRLPPEVE